MAAFEPEIILAVISSIATLAGGIQSAIASELQNKFAKWVLAKLRKDNDAELVAQGSSYSTKIKVSDVVVGDTVGGDKVVIAVSDGTRIARDHVKLRLKQIDTAKNKEQRLSRAFTWSSNLLTFAQYVVGGVLATSFIQQKLSPNLIGFFGLIVLVSSIIKQHYHPEVKAKVASQKAAKLQTLIRDSEDKIAALHADGNTDPKEFLTIASQISAALAKIDHADAELNFEKKALAKKKAENKDQSADS